jgi:hypothetical protein
MEEGISSTSMEGRLIADPLLAMVFINPPRHPAMDKKASPSIELILFD